jgi:hypothetical protein
VVDMAHRPEYYDECHHPNCQQGSSVFEARTLPTGLSQTQLTTASRGGLATTLTICAQLYSAWEWWIHNCGFNFLPK